jgi:hypothetical protein
MVIYWLLVVHNDSQWLLFLLITDYLCLFMVVLLWLSPPEVVTSVHCNCGNQICDLTL